MYLTQEQRDAYERDGFIILPNLVSIDEVCAYQARPGARQRPQGWPGCP